MGQQPQPLHPQYDQHPRNERPMSYRLKHQNVGFSTDPETNQEHPGISGNFLIPSYQRGYRWTAYEVTKLLDDIWKSASQPYSLQPIVVKKMKGAVDTWELIDGQQRLTTLWLIFNYMQKNGYKRSGAAYTLQYATRPGSQAYLQQLDRAQSGQNIDYFHLHQAHQTIDTWVHNAGASDQAKEARVNRLYDYLSSAVRVIWYEVPEHEAPIPLFTRLNQGRIPLTDAELIKAVLLTQIAKDKPGREIEVAAQWDGIERDLQRAEIWAFIAPQHSQVQAHGTRIDLLLDALAQKPAHGALRYHTFDALQGRAQNDSQAFWDEVVALHAQILGWFEEPRWHNKIGFLIACGLSMADIRQLAEKQGKQAFDAALTARIKEQLGTRAHDLDDTLRYDNTRHHGTLQRLLLLFNVQTCRDERFPFKKHTGQAWSLEHIHAQNAQDLIRAEQWDIWLQEHRLALHDIQNDGNAAHITPLLADIDAATSQIHTKQFGQEQFKALAGRILLALNNGVEEEADHSIANLALLTHGANAALSNAVFEVKRQKVLAMDRGNQYIPAATRNVFLKYYTPADRLQPHFWSDADKAAYLHTLKTALADYLQ